MQCGRCNQPLVRNHDELVCLVDGTQHEPVRAHDAVEEPGPQRNTTGAARAGERWTAGDLHFLITSKDRLSSKQVAMVLGRSERSVDHMRSKLGLKKARVRNLDTPLQAPLDVAQELEDALRPGQLKDVARRLGLTYRGAYLRLYYRGVRVRGGDGTMSIGEVVRLYGCSRRRVLVLIRRGVLVAERPARTVVRIDPASVQHAERLLRARSRFTPKENCVKHGDTICRCVATQSHSARVGGSNLWRQ